MPPGRGLHRGPGAWNPMLGSSGGSPGEQAGPTGLDVDCQDALQKLLRPVNYPVIAPWMSAAGREAKRDMVKLAKIASDSALEMQDGALQHRQGREPVVVNSKGRARLAQAVPVSADRAQVDLLRNRHGEDQRDSSLAKKRQFAREYHPVPSAASVNDFYRLGDVPVATDESTKVLTEQARRRLQYWQVRGPERDPETAAQVMRSLRSLSSACARVMSFADHSASQSLGEGSRASLLFEYSRVAPKGSMRTLKPRPQPLAHSRSMPTVLRPIIEPDEVDAIQRPGGFVVGLNDVARIQFMKNRERNKSKITMAGGQQDWLTTAEAGYASNTTPQ